MSAGSGGSYGMDAPLTSTLAWTHAVTPGMSAAQS